MGLYNLVEGGVGERFFQHRGYDTTKLNVLRKISPQLIEKILLIRIDLRDETENMANAIHNIPDALQELDEMLHQIDIENDTAYLSPSIDTSVPNKGVFGYDQSPEIITKGEEAQAKAHADFMKNMNPVTQEEGLNWGKLQLSILKAMEMPNKKIQSREIPTN